MIEEFYLAFNAFNYLTGKRVCDKFSRVQWYGVVGALALGLDAAVAPEFCNGKTFHEYLGFSFKDNVEYGIQVGERIAAVLGMVYHLGTNSTLLRESKKDSSVPPRGL